ncbi:MAG: hypothetical protein IJL30_04515 [Clostridia bacterium]|nr:hypothetical protein [Clostridia bacterium]
MKKAVKMCLVIMMSIIVFVACAPQEKEIFDVDFTFESDKTDLEGVTVKYMRRTGDQSFSAEDEQVLGYAVDTMLADLAVQRIKDVQENLNCILDISYYSDGSVVTNFRMSIAAGVYFCDVISGTSDTFRDSMKAGTLVGLSELGEYADFHNEDKWGKSNVLEILYWNDDAFGFIPAAWPTASVSYRGLTVVNEDLINALNAEDPRDLYENGKWTWGTFRECLEKYYVEEGGEVKHYALSSSGDDVGANYLLSNGFKVALKGTDGKYHSGITEPYALEAMDEANYVYYGALSHTIDRRGGNTTPVEALVGGKTVLGVMHYVEYVTSNIAKQMTNFGLLPWPSGPNVEPGYMACHYTNLENVLVVPQTTPHLEATALTLDALYAPFEQYPDLDSVKDLLYHTYFFDRRDADVYFGMFLSTQFTRLGAPTNQALGEWITSRVAPSEYIESHLEKLEEYIEEEVAPSKIAIEIVWGE